MKFGDTLQQRSVPQWSNYNVDYDDLKQLIKERTLGGNTTIPMSIPGQEGKDAGWAQLESDLFPILCEQHGRVNLFTRSKYGELERRIDYVDRQTRLLSLHTNMSPFRPVQNTGKYARLVQEADRVGQDIQSLSRYVATQKQAFRKILKKYRKWTGSSALQLRMEKDAFNQPDSVLNLCFVPLLDRLAAVKSSLAALPQPCGSLGAQGVQEHQEISADPSSKPESVASRLHNAFSHASPLDFDAAFLAVPFGIRGGRAVYWIHKDNHDELTVLLRRYMKDRRGATRAPALRNVSVASLPMLLQSRGHSAPTTDRTHISMFDNLHRFFKAHEAVSTGQPQDVVGSVPSILAMSILWTNEPEAVVVTSDLSPSAAPSQHHLDVAHVATKDLARVFEPVTRPAGRSSKGPDDKSLALGTGLQVCREWLAKNRDIKPLAEVQCTRSRFAGINNTSEIGTWALLDVDITMAPIDLLNLGHNSAGDPGHVHSFPHAVLEVRWEFSRTPEIVRVLDSSNLVERIQGFSLEAQAISTICKTSGMQPPIWQSSLERDIRKVPPVQMKSNARKNTTRVTSTEPSSTDGHSTSVFSQDGVNSPTTSSQGSGRSPPPTSPPNSRQKTTKIRYDSDRKPPRRKPRREVPAMQRYWNEFDDGDDVAEDHIYAIYVNPDEHISLPGVQTVSKTFSSIFHSLCRTTRRLIFWLPITVGEHERGYDVEEGVRKPLLGGSSSRIIEYNEDESSDSDSSSSPGNSLKRRSSITHPSVLDAYRISLLWSRRSTKRHYGHDSQETILFRTYIGCYTIALLLLIMSAILQATGRHKAKVSVDVGVLVGVVAALGSSTIGLSLMISREERLSWLHRALGAGMFLAVCVGSVCLLAVVGRNL